MKKKISSIIIATLISFMFCMSVKAADPTIKCSTSVALNDEFECSVKTSQETMIAPDLAGLKVVKGATEVSGDSTIKFRATKIGAWDISVVGYDSEEHNTVYQTVTINVKEKTTTTTTTTTTKAKSDNNYLASIKVNNEEIKDFTKNTTKYFIEVENDVKKANIEAETEDSKSSVKIDGPKELEIGDNEYTIAVTSESNSTKFYKVIITRLDKEASSNTAIKSIKIKGYRLNFDKNSRTFHLNIKPEDTELDITVKLKDKNASYDIEGNDDLKDGSVIRIKVTAEDDSTSTYRIIISKKQKSIIPLIIAAGASLLIIIIVIVIVLVIKKKKNKDNSDDNDTKKEEKEEIKKPEKRDYSEAIKRVSVEEEKTIEMPSLGRNDEAYEVDPNAEEDDIPYDNDEEEETRILSYAERKELERYKSRNEKTDDEISEAFNKAFDDEF